MMMSVMKSALLAISMSVVLMCLMGTGGCVSPSGSGDSSGLPGHDAALVGTWAGPGQGASAGMNVTVAFKDDGTFTFTMNLGTGLTQTNYGTWSTDESQSPMWINVHNQWNLTWLGVYEVDGNTLKWAEGSTRPASTDSGLDWYVLTKQ